MAKTLEQFRIGLDIEDIPANGSAVFYFDNGWELQALNVDLDTLNGSNLATTLANVRTVLFSYGGTEYTLTVLTSELMGSYYHIVVVPQEIDLTALDATPGYPVTLSFIPSPSDTNFTKSEYQAILNNASDNRSTGFIFDVDRSKATNGSSLRPVNYLSIMSGSGTPAQYQELNYSSIGLSNSRYAGSKTSFEEYGIDASVNLTLFESSIYPLNTSNDNICSQSLEERNFIELGYDSSTNPTVSLDNLPTASYNFAFDGKIGGYSGITGSLAEDEITFTAYMKKSVIARTVKGSILHLYTATKERYVQVESFTYNSPGNTTYAYYDFVVKKNVLELTGGLTANATTNYGINVRVGKSDTVYAFEKNKIVPQGNKKMYLGLTGQVIVTSETGRVVEVSTTCTV